VQIQKETIKEMMVQYLVTQEGIPREVATNGATKLEDLDIDSLNILEMLYEFEDQYGFRIEDLGQVKDMTLDSLASFLHSLALGRVTA
jgi:acyl carrier protein